MGAIETRAGVAGEADAAAGARPGRRPRSGVLGGGVWSPERRTLTAGLVTTITLVAFEALAVATALPVVARDLDGVSLYGWVFSAFFLGNLVGIVAAGLQIDRFGLVRPFAIGLTLFAIGLLVGGLAPAMAVLALARAVQGFGAGAVAPVAYVAIGRAYPEAIRPRMFAILSTAWVVPGLVGPAIAGVVAERLHWRLVFLGLVPFIVLAGVLAVTAMRRSGAVDAADPGGGVGHSVRPVRADARRLVDAVLVAVGAALLLAVGSSPSVLVAVLVALAGLAFGLPALRRLVPARTLTAGTGLPATILERGVLTFGFFGAEAYLPLALVSVRGTTAAEAGLALTAATLSWAAGSWVQARRMERWGHRRLIALGFALVLVGVAGTATIVSPLVPPLVAVVTWGIAGAGMGLAYSPISLLVLREASAGAEGAATSALQLSDVLGTALGTGAGGAILAAGTAARLDRGPALLVAFGVAIAVALGGLLLTRRIPHGVAAGRVHVR